jgi:NADH-quinone oxidoreductase subunit F
MNFDQVQAAAEARNRGMRNPSGFRIWIASTMNDPRVPPILHAFDELVGANGSSALLLNRAGSFGFYDLEPIVVVEKPGHCTLLYKNAAPESIACLIPSLVAGVPKKTGAFCCAGENRPADVPHISGLLLFSLQKRTALRNCGWIDPGEIGQYLERGNGYSGLANALKTAPAEIVELWIPRILRDRKGLGFSDIDHWKLSRSSKVGGTLICNAVDSDPRSQASRLLLEGDPHSVLEGMLIGAYGLAASSCVLWVEEGPLAGKLRRALGQMRGYSLLGANILDSEFSVEIMIEEIPAAVSSGCRTEMMRCLEENRGLPKILPAWPGAEEIGKPVVTATPEMLSSLSAILSARDVEETGSRVVTLSGNINHPYTVEMPSSASIQTIIDIIGGGVPGGKTVIAVQLGGPSGPFVAPEALNRSIGCGEGEESRSDVGFCSIDVLDSDCHIPEKMKEIMASLQAQSCGKCVFCREGCLQILTVLEDISENKAQPQDLDLLVAICRDMRTGCLCAFGRAIPDPVLTSLPYVRAGLEKRTGD